MPKKVLLLLASGFEELEVVAPLDILRRGGAEVKVASVEKALLLKGRNGISVSADVFFKDLMSDSFDLIVIPGGVAGVDALKANAEVLSLLKQQAAEKKDIGAVCAGPLVLKEAGLIKGVKITSHPSTKEELASDSDYIEEAVVEDGIFITSRGAGTAVEFGFALLKKIMGPEVAQKIKAQISYPV